MLDKILDWAKGFLLLAIGAGTYDDAMYTIVSTAYSEGFKAGEKSSTKMLVISVTEED